MQEFAGTFKPQSKNTEVFSAISMVTHAALATPQVQYIWEAVEKQGMSKNSFAQFARRAQQLSDGVPSSLAVLLGNVEYVVELA